MAEHTQNFDLPYPLSSYSPAGADQIQELADAVDAVLTTLDDALSSGANSLASRVAALEAASSGGIGATTGLAARVADLEEHNNALAEAGWKYAPIIYKLKVKWRIGKRLRKGDRFILVIANLTTNYNPAKAGITAHQPVKFRPDVIMGRYGGAGGTQYVRMQPYESIQTPAGDAQFKVLITIDEDFDQVSGRQYKSFFQVTNAAARGGFEGSGAPKEPDKVKTWDMPRNPSVMDSTVLTDALPAGMTGASIEVVPGIFNNDHDGVINVEIL